MQTQANWKKKNIPLVKFKNGGAPGTVDQIEGKYLKRREAGESTTPDDQGEFKTRHTLIFQKLDSDEKFQVWETAGLRSAMEMNDVQENEAVRIVHLGKQPRHGKPGEVNVYDIYTLN